MIRFASIARRLATLAAAVLLGGTITTGEAYAQTRRYTMADLQSLANKQSWQELADHLGDIAPVNRNKAWERLVEQTAIGTLESSVTQQRPLDGIMFAEHLLGRYPVLKGSRPFMDKRGEIGLKAFERCFADRWSSEHCGKELRSFVAADPANLDLAFNAGKLARLNLRHWFAAPFFQSGLAKVSTTRTCGDEDVKLSVLSALVLPAHDNYQPFIDASVAIAADLCWSTLQSTLMETLKEKNSYFIANSCAFLKVKNGVDPQVADACK